MSDTQAHAKEGSRTHRRFARTSLVLLFLAVGALAAASGALGSRDLTVTLTTSSLVADNTTFSVNAMASNSGSGGGAGVEVEIFLDGNSTGPAQNLGNLADGESANATESFTLSCGVYTLNATVDPADTIPETNETNNNVTMTLYVVPLANFTHSLSGNPGDIYLLVNASSSNGCAPLNFSWSIGGLARTGAVVNLSVPAGDLTVTLTARSTANPVLVGNLTKVVAIPNLGPSLSLSVLDNTIRTLWPLALTIQADDMDGSIASYLIAFGDGNNTTSPVVAATYEYHRGGNFTINVTVRDNLGATNTSSIDVTIANQVPEVHTSFPFWETEINRNVTFNATGTLDPEGGALTVAWDFGDGTTGTGLVVNHSYAEAKTYTVTLSVTDEAGSTQTRTITVKAVPTSTPTSGGVPLPIIGGIIGLLALLLLLLLLLIRRRRKDDEEPKPEQKQSEKPKEPPLEPPKAV